MAVLTKYVSLVFNEETCANCRVRFALLSDHMQELRDNGQTFFCPNGHRLHYGGSDERAAALRQKLAVAERRAQEREAEVVEARRQRDHAHRSAAVTRGKAKALRRRIKAGVCPCCHRTFKQLAAHMEIKHPGYASAGDESPVVPSEVTP